MKIDEAIKSGKRFKRKEELYYWDCNPIVTQLFTVECILAEDWEIEEDGSDSNKSKAKMNSTSEWYKEDKKGNFIKV